MTFFLQFYKFYRNGRNVLDKFSENCTHLRKFFQKISLMSEENFKNIFREKKNVFQEI